MGKMARLVTIELDKKRNLLLDMNAMIEFGTATGRDFIEFTSTLQRRISAHARKKAIEGGVENVPKPIEEDLALPDITLRELRAMLWCMLIHEDETLTEKQVGSFITVDNMAEITVALTNAQNANTSEPGPQDAAPPLTSASKVV